MDQKASGIVAEDISGNGITRGIYVVRAEQNYWFCWRGRYFTVADVGAWQVGDLGLIGLGVLAMLVQMVMCLD